MVSKDLDSFSFFFGILSCLATFSSETLKRTHPVKRAMEKFTATSYSQTFLGMDRDSLFLCSNYKLNI